MDTNTHTPGPWKFSDGYITANGKPLSLVGVSIPMTVGPARLEAIHNSRLAAAAPDMLAALKFVESDPCFVKLGSVTHDEVKAAIAKATGARQDV